MYTYIEIRAEYEIENSCFKSNKLINFKHKEVMMSLMDQLNRAIKEAIKIKQQNLFDALRMLKKVPEAEVLGIMKELRPQTKDRFEGKPASKLVKVAV